MKIKFVPACKAFSRFCSHYNLVVWLILYVLAFSMDVVLFKMFRPKTKEKSILARRLVSRTPAIYS